MCPSRTLGLAIGLLAIPIGVIAHQRCATCGIGRSLGRMWGFREEPSRKTARRRPLVQITVVALSAPRSTDGSTAGFGHGVFAVGHWGRSAAVTTSCTSCTGKELPRCPLPGRVQHC